MTALWAEGCGGGFAIGHAYGVRVDGASPRRFLRFLSLTAFWAEGCGGGFAAVFITILTALRSSIPVGHERGALDVQSMRRDSPDLEILCRMATRGRSLMRYGNCISISIIPGTRKQETSHRSPVK